MQAYPDAEIGAQEQPKSVTDPDRDSVTKQVQYIQTHARYKCNSVPSPSKVKYCIVK